MKEIKSKYIVLKFFGITVEIILVRERTEKSTCFAQIFNITTTWFCAIIFYAKAINMSSLRDSESNTMIIEKNPEELEFTAFVMDAKEILKKIYNRFIGFFSEKSMGLKPYFFMSIIGNQLDKDGCVKTLEISFRTSLRPPRRREILITRIKPK